MQSTWPGRNRQASGSETNGSNGADILAPATIRTAWQKYQRGVSMQPLAVVLVGSRAFLTSETLRHQIHDYKD